MKGKYVVYVIILGLFFFLLGVLVDKTFFTPKDFPYRIARRQGEFDKDRAKRDFKRGYFLDRIEKELNLDSNQKEELHKIMEELHKEMQAIKSKYDERIKSILTDEQKEKFDNFKKRYRRPLHR